MVYNYKGSACECLERKDRKRVHKKREHYRGYTEYEKAVGIAVALIIIIDLATLIFTPIMVFILSFSWENMWSVSGYVLLRMLVTTTLGGLLFIVGIRVFLIPIEDRLGIFELSKKRKVIVSVAFIIWLLTMGHMSYQNMFSYDAKFFNKQIDKLEGSEFVEEIAKNVYSVSGDTFLRLLKLSDINSKQQFIACYQVFEVVDRIEGIITGDIDTSKRVVFDEYQWSAVSIKKKRMPRGAGIPQTMVALDTIEQAILSGKEIDEEAVKEYSMALQEMLMLMAQEYSNFEYCKTPTFVTYTRKICFNIMCLYLICKIIYKYNLKRWRKLYRYEK